MQEEGILTEDKNSSLLQDVFDHYVKGKGFDNVKANLENQEMPAKLSKPGGEAYIPDITVERGGTRTYFELAQKTDKVQQVASKWMLLSQLAKMKNGNFVLIIPSGSYRFTTQIVETHGIEAKLVKYSG